MRAVAHVMWQQLLILAGIAAADPDAGCSLSGGLGVAELRRLAVSLYADGRHSEGDKCLSTALGRITTQLEALAAEAEAIRAYRAARKASPTAPFVDSTAGCIIGADGSTVCLGPANHDAGAVGESSVADAIAASSGAAGVVSACASEAEALALVQRIERGECTDSTDAPEGMRCETSREGLEEGLIVAARRHWWEAGKGLVAVLRGRASFQISSDGRRALTEIRDGAGDVLALLRQTKLDESIISCAVMWAQGEHAVYLNVKFAARLDAPVTVLNVDNEVVTMNATHVSFSGVGRQKPKRYVMDLELFGDIDADASSWSFGSVGTVRFTLTKAEPGEWKRLTRSQEPVRNHRVWWEHQEKVQAEDKARRKVEKEARDKADRAEKEAKEEGERAERERVRADAKATARAEQLESIRVAVADLEALLASPGEQTVADTPAAGGAADGTAGAGARDTATNDAGGEPAPAALADASDSEDPVEAAEAAASAGSPRLPPLNASFASTLAALEAAGQGANETAVAHAQHLVSNAHALSSTEFPELMAEALANAKVQYRAFLEGFVEPASAEAPAAPRKSKRKRKKKGGDSSK